MSVFNSDTEEGKMKANLYPYMDKYTSFLKKMERPLIGRDDEMMSLMAAMERPELCNAILLADAGCGKANACSSILPVADSRGCIRLGDVNPGDKVFNEEGEPVVVMGVFPQGRLHAYRVVFADGSSVVCNDEHLWAVRTKKDRKNGIPFSVHTLRYMMDQGKSVKWSVPCNGAVQRPDAMLKIDPYLMGVLLCSGRTKELGRLAILTKNKSCAVNVSRILGAMACADPYVSHLWRFVRGDGHFIRTDDVPWTDSGVNVGIPDVYKFSSVTQRLRLIAGMLAASGSPGKSDCTMRFVTYSDVLADDFMEVCRSCGFRVYMRYNAVRMDAGVRMRYNVVIDGSSCATDLEIVAIEDLKREEDMLCIYVDCPSHLFQIGRCHVVTHNTALVQGLQLRDKNRAYLEIDLPKMIANIKNENEMADRLKQLFNEVARYRADTGKEIVLFIDEFHQIVQLSPAAVEVLKPLLADSGTRGIRVIAATTYREFQEYISSNQPLVERLQRINLPEPSKDVVVAILRGMAERYGVINQFKTNSMFELIYEYTNRYIPANAQPRKSILMMDSMIGWHRVTKRPIDSRMLADVIYKTEGVNVAFRVDATKLKEKLDRVVLAQDFATTMVANRMQICCADLNNKERPMSSFLFTGSTGVGKTELSKQLAELLFDNDRSLVRFDMTEYARADALERFREELTRRVWEHPYCIVLFDEIEKACAEVTRMLLQVLDDGRLINKDNQEISFKNTYIIVTTNAGSEIYETIGSYSVDNTGSNKLMEKYEALIKDSIKGTTGGNRFPPELLGRIDCLVPFQPLSEQTKAKICMMKLEKLSANVRSKHRVRIAYDGRVIRYIVQERLSGNASDSGGARGVAVCIDREITTAVSTYINNNPSFMDGRILYVQVEGSMAVDDKRKLDSDAHIIVSDKKLSTFEERSTFLK